LTEPVTTPEATIWAGANRYREGDKSGGKTRMEEKTGALRCKGAGRPKS